LSFFNELKRRNVFRVGVAYLISAWLLIQVADILLDNIGAPPWVLQALFVALAIGLFIALVVAWAFELTPEGIKKEKDVDRSQSITPHTGRKLNAAIIILLVLGLAYFFWESRFSKPDDPMEQAPATAIEKAQGSTEETGTQPEPVINRQSIAVLPFDNRSRNLDDEYFTEGIHDDLLTNLSRINSLKVISRTSVNQYKDTEKSIPVIAAELRVATVMEGAVQRSGEKVRINVQLIDAETDEHLWAEIYDRELTAENLFDIQSEIATAIAAALRAELTDDDAARLAAQPTQNLAAYEAYLLGRQRFAKRSGAGLVEAAVYFQQAIDLDPDFSLAYIGLADTYQVQGDWGLMSVTEANSRSLPLAERALQLDDRSGEAYVTLASIHEFSTEFEAAGEAYRKGLELAPNYPQASFWYGLYLTNSMGKPAEAVKHFEHALSLDPLSTIVMVNLAFAHMALGEFEMASAMDRKALNIDPTFSTALTNEGWIAWTVKGDLVTGIDYSLQAHAADPDDQWAISQAEELFTTSGDKTTGLCLINEGQVAFRSSPFYNTRRALLAVYEGDAKAAVLYARNAIENTWIPNRKFLPLAILQADLQLNGLSSEVLTLYQEHFPELLESPPAGIDRTNFQAAVELAGLLQTMDRQAEAQLLLDGTEKAIREIPRLGEWGYGIEDVRIHTLRGENEKALGALRTAVDLNWRLSWPYYLDHDPVLEPIRSDPRFQEIVQEIRADMAAQLEQVRSRGLDQGICDT